MSVKGDIRIAGPSYGASTCIPIGCKGVSDIATEYLEEPVDDISAAAPVERSSMQIFLISIYLVVSFMLGLMNLWTAVLQGAFLSAALLPVHMQFGSSLMTPSPLTAAVMMMLAATMTPPPSSCLSRHPHVNPSLSQHQ